MQLIRIIWIIFQNTPCIKQVSCTIYSVHHMTPILKGGCIMWYALICSLKLLCLFLFNFIYLIIKSTRSAPVGPIQWVPRPTSNTTTNPKIAAEKERKYSQEIKLQQPENQKFKQYFPPMCLRHRTTHSVQKISEIPNKMTVIKE